MDKKYIKVTVNNLERTLVELVLPAGILDYFELTSVKSATKEIWIYLKEKNEPPEEFKNDKLESKGFLPEAQIQDLPIQGKKVFLMVKRRKWYNSTMKKSVTRDWEIVQKGTHYSKMLAIFFQELARFKANQLK